MGQRSAIVLSSLWGSIVEGDHQHSVFPTGRYSPLRYPGGKGKLVRFVRSIIRANGLSDGLYVEPYAGGAAVAWELLITGVVRRVAINDISRPIYCFWKAVLEQTDELSKLIHDARLTVEEWDRCKVVFRNHECADELMLAYSFFFLNRTNRSGILNGGIIGGREQTGQWKIDARFNKADLIRRINKIASLKSRISLHCGDALDFMSTHKASWQSEKALVYVDPPYFMKGRDLYYDFYQEDDHRKIAKFILGLKSVNWLVSYDDVRPIHDLYETANWLQYAIGYSARNRIQGREAMFFSENIVVPGVSKPLSELGRGVSSDLIAASDRAYSE